MSCSHASDHDQRLAKKGVSRWSSSLRNVKNVHDSYDQKGNSPGADKAWSPSLALLFFIRDLKRTVKLDVSLSLIASHNDSSAPTEVLSGQRPNSAQTRAKIDGMASRFRKVGRLGPVDRRCEDVLAKRASQRRLEVAHARLFRNSEYMCMRTLDMGCTHHLLCYKQEFSSPSPPKAPRLQDFHCFSVTKDWECHGSFMIQGRKGRVGEKLMR